MLEELDDTYMEHSKSQAGSAASRPAEGAGPAAPVIQQQPLNTALFDAMFG